MFFCAYFMALIMCEDMYTYLDRKKCNVCREHERIYTEFINKIYFYILHITGNFLNSICNAKFGVARQLRANIRGTRERPIKETTRIENNKRTIL